jgi:GrpB-like predicted nucleotidyltransferase (UPF0157 family)
MNDQESLLAAINEKIELCDYDASWPARFHEECDRLAALLPGVFIEIAHVGSTAVPGLRAKPIIDILAGVASMPDAESVADPLFRSGYTTSAEFNASLVDRKWFMRWRDGHRTHHLHVVVHGSGVWHEYIRFRDVVRAQPEVARRYAELKSGLTAKHALDREAYTQAKEDFVRSVLQGA